MSDVGDIFDPVRRLHRADFRRKDLAAVKEVPQISVICITRNNGLKSRNYLNLNLKIILFVLLS